MFQLWDRLFVFWNVIILHTCSGLWEILVGFGCTVSYNVLHVQFFCCCWFFSLTCIVIYINMSVILKFIPDFLNTSLCHCDLTMDDCNVQGQLARGHGARHQGGFRSWTTYARTSVPSKHVCAVHGYCYKIVVLSVAVLCLLTWSVCLWGGLHVYIYIYIYRCMYVHE